jgi:hypothetical protein
MTTTEHRLQEVGVMKWFSAAAMLGVLAVCVVALGQQSVGLPTTEQAVFYAPYIVTAQVLEVEEFEGKDPWQWVKYKLVDTLKGKLKEKEFRVMFVQTVQGSQGYALPLPDSFLDKEKTYVVFFETFVDKDEKEKFRAVTPDPHVYSLEATDDYLKEVKKHLKEWEKDEKELQAERKKKSLVSKNPFFKITKANNDWVITDLERRKRKELELSPTPDMKQRVEAKYSNLKCQIFNQKAHSYLKIFSKKAESNVRIADAQKWVEDDVKKSLPGATITSAKMVETCGERGYAFKYEWTTPDGKLKNNYERYVFIRNGHLFDIIMWCPAGNYDVIGKDFKKMMKSFRF